MAVLSSDAVEGGGAVSGVVCAAADAVLAAWSCGWEEVDAEICSVMGATGTGVGSEVMGGVGVGVGVGSGEGTTTRATGLAEERTGCAVPSLYITLCDALSYVAPAG